MNIGSREVFNSDSSLYTAQIEYIQSDGQQWINTKIVPRYYDAIEMDAMFTDTSKGVVAYGMTGSGSCWYGLQASYYWGVQVSSTGYGVTATNRFKSATYRKDSSHLVYSKNGSSTWTTVSNSSNPSIWTSNECTLFGAYNGSKVMSYMSTIRLYSFRIFKYDGSEVLRDMIPVRVDQVGCLYDKISGEIFMNQGTGSFIVGPDIK